MSSIAQYIEMPLKFLQWLLAFVMDYFLFLLVIAGCSYLIYKVLKNREKIAKWIKSFGKPKQVTPLNYWSDYILERKK